VRKEKIIGKVKPKPKQFRMGSIVHVHDTKVMPIKVFRNLMIKPHFWKSGLQQSLRKRLGGGTCVGIMGTGGMAG